MKLISVGVCAAQGFKANGIHCGIRSRYKTVYGHEIACGGSPLIRGAPGAGRRDRRRSRSAYRWRR